MEYITHNQADINPIGTYLMGHCESETTYHKLVSIFGEPQEWDAYKVDAEWVLRFSDDLVATIYNYKTGKNYLGEDGKEKEDISGYEWHIGGTTAEVVSRIHGIISGNPCYKLIGSDAKQAKHTQGPWNVAKPNCGLGIFDTNRRSIAAISSNQSRSWEEKEANARLIASAPDLLEALIRAEKRLIDLWEIKNQKARLELTGGSVVGSNAAQEANELWIEIEEIRAAIAKAKGVGV